MWLGVEAQSVIALRMLPLATSGALAKRESGRMVAEAAASARSDVIGAFANGRRMFFKAR